MQRTQRDGARTVVTASTSIAVVAVDSVSDGASIVLQQFARMLPDQHNLAFHLLLQRSEAVRSSSLGRAATCAALPMQSQPLDATKQLVVAAVQQQQQCSSKASAVQASSHGGLGGPQFGAAVGCSRQDGMFSFVLHSPLTGSGLCVQLRAALAARWQCALCVAPSLTRRSLEPSPSRPLALLSSHPRPCLSPFLTPSPRSRECLG